MTVFDAWLNDLFERERIGQPAGDSGGDTVLGVAYNYNPPSESPDHQAFWSHVAALRQAGVPLFPNAELRRLAGVLYRKRYWDKYRCDELPPMLAYAFADGVVNQPAYDPGPEEGVVEMLQAAVKTTVDGKLGPGTIAAAHHMDQTEALKRFMARRARRYFRKSKPEWHNGLIGRTLEVYYNARRLGGA